MPAAGPLITIALVGLTSLTLTGCGSQSASHDQHGAGPSAFNSTSSPAPTPSGGDHANHHASQLPAGMTPSSDSRYPVGTPVTLIADHMPGMEGAQGTVAGVYVTTTYAVDYTPTTGDAPVKDHEWVVQEELEDPAARPLSKGPRWCWPPTTCRG